MLSLQTSNELGTASLDGLDGICEKKKKSRCGLASRCGGGGGLLLAELGRCGLESRTAQVEFEIPVRCQGDSRILGSEIL